MNNLFVWSCYNISRYPKWGINKCWLILPFKKKLVPIVTLVFFWLGFPSAGLNLIFRIFNSMVSNSNSKILRSKLSLKIKSSSMCTLHTSSRLHIVLCIGMKNYTNYNWGCICTINQNLSTYKIDHMCQLVILEEVELVFTFFMGSSFGSSKWLVSWSNFCASSTKAMLV